VPFIFSHFSPNKKISFAQWCFIFCTCLFVNLTHSTQLDYHLKFDHVSVAEGLSDGSVFSIVSDKHGFLWVATYEGLSRYDGSNFVVYRHKNGQSKSIANNLIRKLFIDKDNVLWVGTQQGLSRYNMNSDDFDSFYHDPSNKDSLLDDVIMDIFQDHKGTMFVSTDKGVQKFEPSNNSFKKVTIRGFENEISEIKTIAQDTNSNYWFGSYGKGIYLANKNLNKAENLKHNNTSTSLWPLRVDANVLYDFKVINDDFWLATDNGLFIVSSDYNLKEHITHESSNANLLSNEIRVIEFVSDDIIWLGTRKGLNQISLNDYKIEALVSVQKNTADMAEYWLTSMHRSPNGKLIIGTYGQGLYIYNPATSIFKYNSHNIDSKDNRVTSIAARDSDKTTWFTNEKGNLFKILNLTTIQQKLPENIEVRQVKIVNNNIVLNTYDDRLYTLNTKTSQLAGHQGWELDSLHLKQSHIFVIKDDLCYIAESHYLRCYEYQKNTFIDPLDAQIKALGVSQNEQLIVVDINNNVLIKSGDTKDLESIYKINDEITSVKFITANSNWLWYSNKDQGIFLVNRNNDNITNFTENNGLKNSSISAMVMDAEEGLWVSSNKGISYINPNLKTIQHFDWNYGIDNAQFIEFSKFSKGGEHIYFGSTNGLYDFKPKEALAKELIINPPVLTQITIANKKIDTLYSPKNQKKDINTNLITLKTLTINYDQFPLSFDFISPNSNLLKRINYQYRLVGSDEQWINTDHANRRATFTNLSAGAYTFEVKAYDKYNPALFKSKQLNITILPPWWQSNGALFIYGLVFFLCCLYVLMQMRHKRQYHQQIKASEERLKLSLWGSGDEMWDWNIITGKIFRSNIWGTLEFPQDGKRNVGTDHTNIHPYDIPRVKDALNEHFEQKTEHFEATYRVKNQNDQWMWILDRGKIVERSDKGAPTRMTGTLKDISHIKKAEERLRLFAKCIENISDAVVIFDRQFITVDVNKAYELITGVKKASMIGSPLKFERYPDSFTQTVKKHLITNGTWRGEVESRRADNQAYFTDLSIDVIRDESGNISHFVGVFSDVTTRKKNEAELRKLANSDTLTGLPNRSFFQANQHHLVKNKTPHALLVFDLDNFKKINDSMGHQVGDLLLIEVAKRLTRIGNKKNVVYRLGGDEFSIIIENTNDIHTITSVAKNILSVIAQPLKIKNQEIVLYSSIGIVLYPEDGASPQELLKNADTAMYHAKDTGGNKYQFFSDSMNKQAVKRLQVESLIRHGLKDDLFSVFYQPKIEISTGKIAGMEALVRFETPTKGIISPLVFIPVSEETGQIIDIGEIVLRKSCFATKKWVDAGLFDGRIAVNLSAVQFTQPNLVAMISDILRESGLPPKYLELEITEGTVMDSPQKAIETMLQIRAMGINLSLDDFGTGYSSLAYLKKFPLNTLKIDKAFVDDIEISEQGRNMVATIVTIAHNLGLHVVAEGVETNNQLNFLSGLGCEQLQGYLYSKPLAESEFQKYLLSYQITNNSTSSITRTK
jgi:diguanylate cyclase (GGDEF)-like protein/PAS domain S-box-containing protein